MSFGTMLLTDSGESLLGKVMAGGTLQFNRVAIGDGVWVDGIGDPAWTGLVSSKISVPVGSVARAGAGRATITAVVLHEDLISTGFFAKEIGVFAQDPDIGEILYGIAYSGEQASWIPSTTGTPSFQKAYSIGVGVGSATTITVQVDPANVMATVAQVQELEVYAQTIVKPNLIVNPEFNINQEVVAAGSHAAGVYFRDQWMAGSSGCAVSLSGNLLTISSGGIAQRIEDLNIPNGTYTISWEGTAQVGIDGTPANNSPHTFTVASGTHVEIRFGTGTVRRPVLVEGTVAGMFVRRMFADELRLCHRYFAKSYTLSHAPGAITIVGSLTGEEIAASNLFHNIFAVFPAPMRAVPTVTVYSPITGASGKLRDINNNVDVTVSTPTNLSERGFSGVLAAVAIAQLQDLVRVQLQYTANARI